MPDRKRGGLTCPHSIQAICFVPTVSMPAGLVVNLPRHGAAAIGSYFRPRLVVPLLRRTTPRVPACRGEARPRKASGLWRLSLDEASTRRFISRPGSTFPVGPSADGPHVRELTGRFVNPDPESIQETGFVLPPDGRVVVSVYFSGVIGRLTPEEVMGLVRYLRLHDPPPDALVTCRRGTGWPPQD